MLSCVYQVDCRTFGAFQAVGTKLCHSILIPERIDGDLVGEQVASEVSSTKTIPRCQHQGWEIGVYGCGIVKTTRLIVCVSLKHGCFMLFLTYPFPVCDDWMWHHNSGSWRPLITSTPWKAVLNFILSRTIRTSGCLVSMKVLWSQMRKDASASNDGESWGCGWFRLEVSKGLYGIQYGLSKCKGAGANASWRWTLFSSSFFQISPASLMTKDLNIPGLFLSFLQLAL